MLKRYSVENFSSFKARSTLDLTAGKNKENAEHIVTFDKTKILKTAVLYGANASGKSNIIKSISYAKSIILKNLDQVDTYKKYFRLDDVSHKNITQFIFELEINNQFFSYGFSSKLETKEIDEEWLFKIGIGKPKKIFERKKNKISLGKDISTNLRFKIYAEDMKNQSAQLFLSEIAGKELSAEDVPEVKSINDIYQWFNEKLIVMYPDTINKEKSLISENENISNVFKKYLNEFDTGVVDISQITENFDDNLKEIPKKIKKDISLFFKGNKKNRNKKRVIIENSRGELLTIYDDPNEGLTVKKLGLIHNKEVNEIFELKDESDGTRRLFDLIPLIEKFAKDYTIIIDEFDRSLHPSLTRKFFELFFKINAFKTQLIVTTHESTLLDLSLLRRDEIWFIEKIKGGSSCLFSLNKFKERYDKKVEKAYLLGRYGAVPVFKDFSAFEEGE